MSSFEIAQNILTVFLRLSTISAGEQKTIPADNADKSTKGFIVIHSLSSI